MTTELLGFDTLSYNVVYAQMGRGKTERIMAQAMSSVAATLARLAMDNTMFLNQNFNFISYPAELTTGSSIMPHKKNPDVWGVDPRQVQPDPGTAQPDRNDDDQPAHRLQPGPPAAQRGTLPGSCRTQELSPDGALYASKPFGQRGYLNDPKYDYLFSVEVVNDLVLHGTPFREAYKKVGLDIENGTFKAPHTVHHTHEGSIGNLCTQRSPR